MVGRIWQIILNTPCTPAGAADPIAYGQPAPGPTMEQCLRVEVLVPSWFRKLSNWRPKSFQNLSQEASWRGLGGCLGGVLGGVLGALGGSWDLLGASWEGLGPKMAPRAENASKS